jgi:hypothetical protein
VNTLPAPKSNPVISRLRLVDVQKPKYWHEPSTIKGRSITILQGSEGKPRNRTKGERKQPITMPVQRAHKGSCIPRIVKERLCSWWHPSFLPRFIHQSQRSYEAMLREGMLELLATIITLSHCRGFHLFVAKKTT